jgi:hypothetical protein
VSFGDVLAVWLVSLFMEVSNILGRDICAVLGWLMKCCFL